MGFILDLLWSFVWAKLFLTRQFIFLSKAWIEFGEPKKKKKYIVERIGEKINDLGAKSSVGGALVTVWKAIKTIKVTH